ncbi:MAG: hypothetical protein WCO37_08955 [Bacteroidota bacterium]
MIKNRKDKKKLKGTICTLFLFILFSCKLYSQSVSGPTNFQITLGTSTGFLKYALSNSFISNTYASNLVVGTPPLNIFVEQVSKRTIFGVAFSHELYKYSPQVNNPNLIKDRQQNITFITAGLRFAYKLVNKKNNSFYGGIRINYLYSNRTVFQNTQNTQNNPNNPNNPRPTPVAGDTEVFIARRNRPGSQLFIGDRYFFNDVWGASFELAIGRPYFALFGFSYKLVR